MAFGDTGNPVAFGKGQTADDRALFLKVFGGEVLAEFTAQTHMKGKLRERNIQSGKSAQFPRTGHSKAEYITRGQEMLGNDFETGEVEISIDGLLAAHHDVYDLDAAMSHFEIRSAISQEMGQALARVYDQNAYRSVILSARSAAIGTIEPGGKVIADDALKVSAADGYAWVNAIRQAVVALRKKNVPKNATLFASVPEEIFDALKYAKDTNGRYLVLNSEYGGQPAGGVQDAPREFIRISGVNVFSSTLIPNTNESADATVYSKYRADYSKTVGALWTPDAAGVVQLLGVEMETARDARRKSDFMSATMAVGMGTLRGACAVEFKSVT